MNLRSIQIGRSFNIYLLKSAPVIKLSFEKTEFNERKTPIISFKNN